MDAGRLTTRLPPTDSRIALSCIEEGAALSAAVGMAAAVSARPRAIAGVAIGLIAAVRRSRCNPFILFPPDRNFGHIGAARHADRRALDRKSTRLNSSH